MKKNKVIDTTAELVNYDVAQNAAQGVCSGYQKPELVFYGDVRDVTLGPTNGVGESGCEFDRRMGNPVECP